MAVIGCYTLDLYCDTGGDPYGGTCPQHRPGVQRLVQFTGRTEADCLKQARRRGWTFKAGATLAICPSCSQSARPKS